MEAVVAAVVLVKLLGRKGQLSKVKTALAALVL